MLRVEIHEARLAELVDFANSGERVIILRAGAPVAELVSLAPRAVRRGGQWRGEARIAPDFDAPLPSVECEFGA